MSFLSACVNDAEKQVNPTHVIAFALTLAVIGWVSYVVWMTRTIPELGGCAYLLGGTGALNVAHKVEDIVAKFKNPGA